MPAHLAASAIPPGHGQCRPVCIASNRVNTAALCAPKTNQRHEILLFKHPTLMGIGHSYRHGGVLQMDGLRDE